MLTLRALCKLWKALPALYVENAADVNVGARQVAVAAPESFSE